MRTYLMKIKDKFINAIVSGQKIHEYRLNDNERRKIKCNLDFLSCIHNFVVNYCKLILFVRFLSSPR